MALSVETPRANARGTSNGFWWVNLGSTNAAGAAEFYGRLFGWNYDEAPIGDGLVHRTALLGDSLIAGIDPIANPNVPSTWVNFVYVDDIHAAAARAVQLGATLSLPPMDLQGAGHMAMFLDPQGATVGLWQAGSHTGADAVNQPGTYSWVELATADIGAAKQFYADLFGWEWTALEGADTEYWMASNDGHVIAGAYAKPTEMWEMRTNWAPYFGTADIQACADEVEAAGGTVHVGPQPMGPGTGIAVSDPTGAYFYAIEMREWPAD